MSGTLHQSIGLLLSGKVSGLELDDDNADCLKKGIIGGVTIFKENVASALQLMELTDSIRKVSWHESIISVDQEGGAVQRLDEIASALPSMMALGRLDDCERIKMIMTLSGKQLRLLGINCVLAPVLDINTNPLNPIIGTRSFGESPSKVARLSQAVLRAYLEAGVLPVAKHFPGHGDTDLDSHLQLPKLSHSMERLEELELFPFRENLPFIPAMLVAHLWIECLDKDPLPATLSENVCSRLLKDQLGFKRLAISDDMLMKAIGQKWGLEEACVKAVAAGMDLLLVCDEAAKLRSVHGAILSAVESGRIPEERIYSAVRARQVALDKLPQSEEMERARRLTLLNKSIKAAENLLLESSEAAIELRRGSLSRVFEGEGEIHLFLPAHPRYALDYASPLREEIPSLAGRLIEHRYSGVTEDDEIERLSELEGERCIFVSFRAVVNQGQKRLAEKLYPRFKEHLHIAADLPYDLDILRNWENALAVMDPSQQAIRAFARLCAKQLAPCQFCSHEH